MLLYATQVAVTLARSLGHSRLGLFEEGRLALRVWPHDLDTNRHMNNGRYLTLMDLGRVDLVARDGLGALLLKHRWQPVVAAQTIRYRRSLLPFRRFELCSRTVCWDERSLYLEQRFESHGQLAARAFVRVMFKGPEGTVPPARIAGLLGERPQSPPMPEDLRRWRESEELARVAA